MKLRIVLGLALLFVGLGSTAHAVDDHGDTCGTATALVVDGNSIGGLIDPGTDEDWFSFLVEANHQYKIIFENLSMGFWTNLQIYSSDCSTVIDEIGYRTIIASGPDRAVVLLAAGWYSFK